VKELSELEKCIKKSLIRRTLPSREKSSRSIAKAKRWLEEAEKNFNFGLFDSCLVNCYSAMFHAARAVLFKDGFREKSHYCVARYLEERYANLGKLSHIVVDLLDRMRSLRHEDLYELDFFATKEDAEEAVENAKIVIEKLEKLIEK